MTARQRILAVLKEHPEGLSSNQLQAEARVSSKKGLKYLTDKLAAADQITIHQEEREYGMTNVHKLVTGDPLGDDHYE